MSFRIGEAFVEVHANTDRVIPETERAFRAGAGRLRSAGDDAGRGYGDGLSRGVQRGTQQAEGHLRRLGGVQLPDISGRMVAGLLLVPQAAAAAAAAIAVLPALGASVGLMGGVIAGAFHGVGDALQGYKADQDAASKSAATGAKTATSNARAIRDAQQSIADARRNQARTAEQAARTVEQAERRVNDALDDERKAQVLLNDARKQAVEDLKDLREQVSDLALDEEGAQLAVREAAIRLQTANKDVFSSQIQREQAAYDLKVAEERLSDVQRDRAEKTAKLAESEKAGVNGAPGVVAAAERVSDASQKVADAKEAEREAAESAGQAQEDAARDVARAIQGLKDQQESQAQSAQVAAASSSQYADAMSKLSPAAQAFVRQLIAMKPLVDQLSATAASAFLPGLGQMLRDASGLFPIVNDNIRAAGTIMGDTARQFGQMFKSDEFKANFKATLEAALPLIKAAGDAALVFTDAWFRLGAASAPAAKGLADAIGFIVKGLAGFMDALGPSMGAFGSILSTIGETLGILLPPLGLLVGALAQALAPALEVLLPPLAQVIAQIANALAPVIVATSPILTMLGQIIADIAVQVGDILLAAIQAILPLMPMWSQVVLQLIQAFRPILPLIGQFIVQLIKTLAPFLPDLIGLFMTLIRDAIIPLAPPLFTLIRELLPPLIDLLKWLMPLIVDVGKHFIDDVVWTVQKLVIPALDALSLGVHKIKDAFEYAKNWIVDHWGEIKDAARAPVEFVVNTVYNNGIRKVWNGIASTFGLGQLDEVRFARGGLVPGRDLGYDYVPALLRGGEGVLVPEAVSMLGGAAGIHSLNRRAEMSHFAGGGVAGYHGSSSASVTSAMGSAQASGGFWSDLFTNPLAAIQSLFSGVVSDAGRTPGRGSWRDALVKLPGKVISTIVDKAKSGIASVGPSGGSGSQRWSGVVLQALGMLGEPAGLLNTVLRRMQQESSGNPVNVNRWDSNWKRGTPSVGLMQVIGPTYRSFADPRHNVGPYLYGTSTDPLSNILASMRYARSRYGNLSAAYNRAGGYDLGGVANGVGMLPKYTPEPERVLSPRQTESFEQLVSWLDSNGAGGGRPVTVNVQQTTGSPAETGRFVALALRSV